jgi:hypothetical protein
VTTSQYYCDGCISYNVVISQSDLNLSENGVVYLTYPDCLNENQITEIQYEYEGTYNNDVCIDNCGVAPVLCIIYEGNQCYTNISSYLQSTGVECKPIIEPCDTCFDITVSQEGLSIFDNIVELGQTYGNLEITITANNENDIYEVFVGNAGYNIGEVFKFIPPQQTLTKTVGFISYNSGTKMDLRVYASSTGTDFRSVNMNVCVSCPTIYPCDTPLFSSLGITLYDTSSIACDSISYDPNPTTGNGTTFCNSTEFTNTGWSNYITGTYYVYFNGQFRQVSVVNGRNTVTATTECQNCYTPTPIPTNTRTPTVTPTNTPTNTPTQTENYVPVTPTNTPTNTNTPTVTPTITTSPVNCFYYYLGSNRFSTTYEYKDCQTGQTIQVFVPANGTFGPVCSRTVPTGGRTLNQGLCP